VLRRFLYLSVCAGLAVPALAAGADKLALLRSFELEQGAWTTTFVADDIELAADPAVPADPERQRQIEEFRQQKGYTTQSTDCMTDALAANGDFVLPGFRVGGACTIVDPVVSATTFAVSATCGKAAQIGVTFKGRKSPTTMEGSGNVTAKVAGVYGVIRFSTRSYRVGDCPAE
jgi:hypothetical protein